MDGLVSRPDPPISTRDIFRSFRRSRRRGRCGPIRVSFVELGPDRSLVAFAISRKVGNAVQRNRIRRRLQAVNRELGVSQQPGAYLFSPSVEAKDMPFSELKIVVAKALAAATTARTR